MHSTVDIVLIDHKCLWVKKNSTLRTAELPSRIQHLIQIEPDHARVAKGERRADGNDNDERHDNLPQPVVEIVVEHKRGKGKRVEQIANKDSH